MAEDEVVVCAVGRALGVKLQLSRQAVGHRHRASLVGLGAVELPAGEVVGDPYPARQPIDTDSELCSQPVSKPAHTSPVPASSPLATSSLLSAAPAPSPSLSATGAGCELARTSGDQGDQPTEELERLRSELKDIDQARHRQSLHMEEHDDPRHPVVALAKERVTELSTRRTTIEDTIRATAGQQAQALNAHEIEAALNAIPDLRDTLRSATADELAEILETFDVTATYDKPNRALKLVATLKTHRPPQRRSGQSPGSGGGIRTRDLRVMSSIEGVSGDSHLAH
jgi:hypothetical protein